MLRFATLLIIGTCLPLVANATQEKTFPPKRTITSQESITDREFRLSPEFESVVFFEKEQNTGSVYRLSVQITTILGKDPLGTDGQGFLGALTGTIACGIRYFALELGQYDAYMADMPLDLKSQGSISQVPRLLGLVAFAEKNRSVPALEDVRFSKAQRVHPLPWTDAKCGGASKTPER